MFKVLSILPPEDEENDDWTEFILHECVSYDEAFAEWERAVVDFKNTFHNDPRAEILFYSTSFNDFNSGSQWTWSLDDLYTDDGEETGHLKEVLIASGYYHIINPTGTSGRQYYSIEMSEAEAKLIYEAFVPKTILTIET